MECQQEWTECINIIEKIKFIEHRNFLCSFFIQEKKKMSSKHYFMTSKLDTNSPYYTRGYEFVNGNLMYYEYFKETDSKFYFNKDNELVYLSTESLSNSIETNPKEAYIFEVTISHDNIDNSLIEIPEGYEVKNAEEME